MNTQKKTQFMTVTALLTAIAILIPMVMPFKLIIPPCFLHFRKSCSYFYCYVSLSMDGYICHRRL